MASETGKKDLAIRAAWITGGLGIAAAVLSVLLTHLLSPSSPAANAATSSPPAGSSPPAVSPSPAASAPTGPAPITSQQASSALLAAGQIASIAGTSVLQDLNSNNPDGLLLDLSVPSGLVYGPCQISNVSLTTPAAFSPAEVGFFDLGGGTDIGEQVAAYGKGSGPVALNEARSAFESCGFTVIPGSPANVLKFTGQPGGGGQAEWQIADVQHDVLIEVAVNESGQDAVLDKLLSALEANVGSELR